MGGGTVAQSRRTPNGVTETEEGPEAKGGSHRRRKGGVHGVECHGETADGEIAVRHPPVENGPVGSNCSTRTSRVLPEGETPSRQHEDIQRGGAVTHQGGVRRTETEAPGETFLRAEARGEGAVYCSGQVAESSG